MKSVEPEVYVVAVTQVTDGISQYLKSIGHDTWHSDAMSDLDLLVEAAGRLCYRSWAVYDPANPEGTNRNIEMVRHNNQEYLVNLSNQGHGSVFEHANISVIFKNVSRVFTHELVRHRAGCAYSQESLRYVRVEDMSAWIPTSIKNNSDQSDLFIQFMVQIQRFAETFSHVCGLDRAGSFAQKKALTSLVRRLLPQGMATSILTTANIRAWRHILAMRSSGGAEEEMQFVMGRLAPMLRDIAPSCFQDMTISESGVVTFRNTKI